MPQTDTPRVTTGKPLIESDRVEGTPVYNPSGNNIGSIKRLMIEKVSGKVAYAVMSFGGFLGNGSRRTHNPLEQTELRYEPRRLPHGHFGGPASGCSGVRKRRFRRRLVWIQT